MKKALFAIALLAILCFSCGNIADNKEYKIAIKDNILTIEPNDTCKYQVSVWNEETKLWEQTRQGKYTQGLFSPIEDTEVVNTLALSALKGSNELSIRVSIGDVIDTTFIAKIYPEERDSIAPVIIGNCAKLISNAYSNASSETLKRWLFKRKEFVSDSLLTQMAGLVRTLCKKDITTYKVQGNIPIVKSLGAYSVKSGIKADHYALLACTSDKNIASFVEDCVAKDFKFAKNNLDGELTCYKMGNPNGFLCICLVAINNDWSYAAYPIGAIILDNIPPIILNQNRLKTKDEYDAYKAFLRNKYKASFDNIYLNKKSEVIIIPEQKPNIAPMIIVSSGEFEGSKYSLSMPFTIYFGDKSDIESITIKHPKSGEVAKTVNLKGEKSPYSFRCSLSGMEHGENYIPIEVVDTRGNVSLFKYRQDCQRVENNSPQINIDNNVNVW